jgi:hypothetical protein
LEIPTPGNPTIEEIGESGIGKEGEGVEMVVVYDQISNNGSCNKARERKNIGDVPDLLVAWFVEFEGGL